MSFSILDENPMQRYIPTKDELNSMCAEYQIGHVLAVHGELGGLFNVNVKVTTTTGDYVFRVHSGLSRKNHMDAQALLLAKLLQSNVPVLTPLRTKRGEAFLTLHNRFVQVTRFITGSPFQYTQQADALGKMLRRFHDALSDVEAVPIPYWSNYPSNAILLEGMDILREQQQDGLHDPRLVREVEVLHQMVMEQWEAKANECVKTVIHADWHAWNVIFNAHNQVEHILDFDGLQRGERIHDIAYFIWSMRNRSDCAEIGRDFMRGYGAISPVEKHLLPFAVARASVFFLCTASFTANPTQELTEQMKVQKPYIEWLLSHDGQQTIRKQVSC